MVSAAVKRARLLAGEAKARWRRDRIARMLEQIANGRDRNAAVAEARALGARLQDIGSAIGLTRERVRQICCRHARKAPDGVTAALRRSENPPDQAENSRVQKRPIGQPARAPETGP